MWRRPPSVSGPVTLCRFSTVSHTEANFADRESFYYIGLMLAAPQGFALSAQPHMGLLR